MSRSDFNIFAIVPAAGRSLRMGGAKPKLLLEIDGISVLERSLQTLLAETRLARVVVACPADLIADYKQAVVRLHADARLEFVVGGETRQASVWNALQHIKQGSVANQDRIIVHDAARCMLSAKLLSKILDEIGSSQALSVGLPVIDTIKKVDSGVIVGSLPRNALWAMQTPQAFLFSLIYQAHLEAAQMGDFSATDDVSLVEARTGVKVIEGERRNIKITCAEDLKAAEALL